MDYQAYFLSPNLKHLELEQIYKKVDSHVPCKLQHISDTCVRVIVWLLRLVQSSSNYVFSGIRASVIQTPFLLSSDWFGP